MAGEGQGPQTLNKPPNPPDVARKRAERVHDGLAASRRCPADLIERVLGFEVSGSGLTVWGLAD